MERYFGFVDEKIFWFCLRKDIFVLFKEIYFSFVDGKIRGASKVFRHFSYRHLKLS